MPDLIFHQNEQKRGGKFYLFLERGLDFLVFFYLLLPVLYDNIVCKIEWVYVDIFEYEKFYYEVRK